MPELGVGLLGYGAIAAEHARALSAGGCRLAVVMGPKRESAEAFAREQGILRATIELDEVLAAPDVDAVVVASPNHVHAEQALAALAAGKHVLCEVPLALSAGDAERVAAAAADTDRVCMVCHTQRFWSPVAHLRRLVDERRLTVQHVISRTGMFRRENVGWTGRRRSWIDSVVWHHGSHAVDTARVLLGAGIERVTAEGGVSHAETHEPMDLAILLGAESEALATLVLSYNTRVNLADVVVIGVEETYRVENGTLLDSSGAVVERSDAASMQDDALGAQNAAFLRAIASGEPADPSPADVLPTYHILQRVEELVRR